MSIFKRWLDCCRKFLWTECPTPKKIGLHILNLEQGFWCHSHKTEAHFRCPIAWVKAYSTGETWILEQSFCLIFDGGGSCSLVSDAPSREHKPSSLPFKTNIEASLQYYLLCYHCQCCGRPWNMPVWTKCMLCFALKLLVLLHSLITKMGNTVEVYFGYSPCH